MFRGKGYAQHPSKPREKCPKSDFKFICKNCNSQGDVERYANEMADRNTPVASNLIYNVNDGAEWERNTYMETCK